MHNCYYMNADIIAQSGQAVYGISILCLKLHTKVLEVPLCLFADHALSWTIQAKMPLVENFGVSLRTCGLSFKFFH